MAAPARFMSGCDEAATRIDRKQSLTLTAGKVHHPVTAQIIGRVSLAHEVLSTGVPVVMIAAIEIVSLPVIMRSEAVDKQAMAHVERWMAAIRDVCRDQSEPRRQRR